VQAVGLPPGRSRPSGTGAACAGHTRHIHWSVGLPEIS
jgi:hypothetical protein